MKNRTSCFAVTAMLLPLLAFALPLWGADSLGKSALAAVEVPGKGPSSMAQNTDALTESIVWQSSDPFVAMQDDGNRQPTCVYKDCRFDMECTTGGRSWCKCQGGYRDPDPMAPPESAPGQCYANPFSPPFPIVGN